MSRYDGLIIPRSYSEYINKTDAATLLQALQLSGVMDAAPTSGSNHPAKTGGIYDAIARGLSETRTFTINLVGWANDGENTPYVIKSITTNGYKIADKTYVLFFQISPNNSDPAPSEVLHLIEPQDITEIICAGSTFVRAPGYTYGCIPQYSGTRLYMRLPGGSNWLPSYWGTGTNTIIQGSLIVKI